MKVVCAVRDRAVDAFGTPIFCVAVGEAMRSFIDEINRQGSAFNSHPEDYDLYEIGIYHEDKGRIEVPGDPRMICVGKDVVKPLS